MNRVSHGQEKEERLEHLRSQILPFALQVNFTFKKLIKKGKSFYYWLGARISTFENIGIYQ